MDVFLYTIDPTADEPIMLINNFIGFDEEKGYGIMGDLFQKELLSLDAMGKNRIKVYINSPGGSVIDGYNIFNAILKSKAIVDTYCVGMAASIAGVIFQAGRKRIMADYSRLMYHDAEGSDDAKGLNEINESIVTMISSRTGKSEDEVKKIMAKTTWINPQEALDSGFCDEIENSGEVNKKYSFKDLNHVKLYKKYQDIVNNLFQIQNNKTMSDLTSINNKLKLNPEASAEAVNAEIDKIVNRAEKAEKDCKDAKEEEDKAKNSLKEKEDALKAKEKEVEDLKAEVKKMKDEKEKSEKDAKDKEEKETADKAKNYVADLVKAGKIKNEPTIIEPTEKKFIADFEGMKNLFENMPVNRPSTKIDVQKIGDGKVGSVISMTMATNYAKAAGEAK